MLHLQINQNRGCYSEYIYSLGFYRDSLNLEIDLNLCAIYRDKFESTAGAPLIIYSEVPYTDFVNENFQLI